MQSALGAAVINNEIPKIHDYYPMVDVWQVCLMPDHIHMIVRISRPLPQGKHLGIIIGAFKGGVSRAWWQLGAPRLWCQPQSIVRLSSSPTTTTTS